MHRRNNAVKPDLTGIALKVFGAYPNGFRQYLLDHNYAADTIACHLRCVGIFAYRMDPRSG